MKSIKIGVIREGKVPPDMRVPLTPIQCKEVQEQYPEVSIHVQSSPVRAFSDSEYSNQGIRVQEDVSDCDVLMGVKEVPIDQLIDGKTYLFFSHTIKEQPYNRKLLRAILEKNIRLIDYETLTNSDGIRIIGFGYYAGIVGAYNGIRAWGMRTKTFFLKPALQLDGLEEMNVELQKAKLPNIRIALTGAGRVASGVLLVMRMMEIMQVSPEDYLANNYDFPVFTQLCVTDYNKRMDGKPAVREDFFHNFKEYESNFFRFAEVTDLYIAGHFYAEHSPFIFTREDAKSPTFRIKVVADISCDIDGPVACTIRSSTIAEPLYGYHPILEQEVAYDAPDAITVMAVDNLPCELPKVSSEGFGKELVAQVIPQFLNGDEGDILKRATIAENGKLLQRYTYLQDFVDGKTH